MEKALPSDCLLHEKHVVLTPNRGVTQLTLLGDQSCSDMLILCAHQLTSRITLNITAKLDGIDALSLTLGNLSDWTIFDRQIFDGTQSIPQSITYDESLGKALVARLQLEGKASSSTSHMSVRYECTPVPDETFTAANFWLAMLFRFGTPVAIFCVVARLVLRRRRNRFRRHRVIIQPPYETLQEDAEVVVATLAMLPLISYRELREECDAGQRSGAAASREGAEHADATAAESADGSSWGGSAHLDAWFFPDADSLAQECGICLERFKDDQLLRVLPCHHFFCAECIERWFETRGLNGQLATRGLPCPMCKADATEDLFANRPGLENQCVESR